MFVRTDPFRELEALTQRPVGTTSRPAVMPLDAWKQGDQFVVEFDLPGVDPESVELNVERNVLTVNATRPAPEFGQDVLANERPHGVFTRELILGQSLDNDQVSASYRSGVLRLEIPVSEKWKPRKVAVNTIQPAETADAADEQPAGDAKASDRETVNA